MVLCLGNVCADYSHGAAKIEIVSQERVSRKGRKEMQRKELLRILLACFARNKFLIKDTLPQRALRENTLSRHPMN